MEGGKGGVSSGSPGSHIEYEVLSDRTLGIATLGYHLYTGAAATENVPEVQDKVPEGFRRTAGPCKGMLGQLWQDWHLLS
jgi:hypothetical protein